MKTPVKKKRLDFTEAPIDNGGYIDFRPETPAPAALKKSGWPFRHPPQTEADSEWRRFEVIAKHRDTQRILALHAEEMYELLQTIRRRNKKASALLTKIELRLP